MKKKMYEYRKHQSQQKSERDNKKQENKKYLQICTWKLEKKKKKAVDVCAEINFNCVHSCFISQNGKLFIVFCVCL